MSKLLVKYAGTRDEDKAARVNWIKRQFDRYDQYWTPEIEFAIRNARMYWFVNFGMWPVEVVEKLRQEGRRPPSIPVIPDKVESLVGNFIANQFDMKVSPRTGKHTSLTMKAEDILLSDKYNLDWETSEILTLLDSFIKVGYERMHVTDLKDPFGNIAWETINPRHTFLCPAWKSPYVRDLTDYFVWDDKTVAQMKSLFPGASARLNEQYERELREGVDYGYNYGSIPRWKSAEEKWDGMHRVIEYHHVRIVDRMYEYDKKNMCWFPDTGYKQNTNEDKFAKLIYAQQHQLSPDDIVMLKQKKRTKYVEAICPDLDRELFLSHGKDTVQTNNVNIYPLGIRYYGQFQGIVDRLYDLNIGINKGEMNIQDIQSRAAKGAMILDRALSGGDPELERQIEAGWNDPAARIWVDEGSTERLPKGGIIQLPTVAPNADMFNQTNRYYDLSDRFSKVPAAQDSRSESGQESGRLFKFKFEAGIIQQKYLQHFYQQHKRDKMEAAFCQARITYSGVPRTFNSPGRESITINTEAIDMFTGNKIILDDISTLPEMSIVLTPSKHSLSVRQNVKETSGELLQYTKDPLIALVLEEHIALTSELAEEEKEEVKHAFSLAKLEAAMAKNMNIKDAQMKVQMIESKIQGILAQKAGMGMAPEQGAGEEAPEQQMSIGGPPEEKMMEGTPQELESLTSA